MTDPTPQPPDSGSDPAPPLPIDLVRIGVCPCCEYDLKGLPLNGKCPECGTEYQAETILAPQSLPSALSLCFRYGWPLIIVVFFGPPAVLGRGDESMFCCASLGLLLIPVNGVVQALILRNHPVMSRTHLKAISPRVRRLSHIGLVFFIMTVVVPLVIFGGCVLLLMVNLRNIH